MIEILFLIILGVIYFFYKNWSIEHTREFGAPYLALSPSRVDLIMKIANVSKDDIFFDLGSGDGRVVIAAAMRGAKAVGLEMDSFRVFYSSLWIKLLRLEKNAKIFKKDLFKTNLSDATVVCLYLLPKTHQDLKEKLIKELKKGTKVIAVSFPIEGWKAKKARRDSPFSRPIYLYKI